MRRVMLFVSDVEKVGAFYVEKLGLKVAGREKGFWDLDAGSCRLALHATSAPQPGRTKLCFFADDVAAARDELVARGVKMGVVKGDAGGLQLCDGKDPDGHVFQLSNRA